MLTFNHGHAPAARRRKTMMIIATPMVAVALLTGCSLGDAHSHLDRDESAASAHHGEADTGAPLDAHFTRAPGGPRLTLTTVGRPPLSGRATPVSNPAHSAKNHTRTPSTTEDEETETRENSNPTSVKPLSRHTDGRVQTAPHIYLVFWGPNWFTGGDPNGVANRLHYFYQGLSGSPINNVLKQYPGTNGTYSNPAAQYKGWIQDTSAVPSRPTRAQVAAAAQRAANRIGDYGVNAQYVIATPNGVVDQFLLPTTTNKLTGCAWHNWTAVGSTWVTYTSLPYTPYMDRLGGCGANHVNAGAAGTLDGVTINAYHEYAETVSDPGLGTWFDIDGSENADKCAWTNLRNYTLTNGYAFPVQPTWSNQWRTTYGTGCLYS